MDVDSVARLFMTILFANRLGHGRRMEGFLLLAKVIGAVVFFLFPSATELSGATYDLYWLGLGNYLFGFFLLAALLSGYGLLANIHGWPGSRMPRVLGAGVGFFIWFFLSMKLLIVGDYASEGFVLGVVAMFYGELGTIFYAVADLPRPGAMGNLGA